MNDDEYDELADLNKSIDEINSQIAYNRFEALVYALRAKCLSASNIELLTLKESVIRAVDSELLSSGELK